MDIIFEHSRSSTSSSSSVSSTSKSSIVSLNNYTMSPTSRLSLISTSSSNNSSIAEESTGRFWTRTATSSTTSSSQHSLREVSENDMDISFGTMTEEEETGSDTAPSITTSAAGRGDGALIFHQEPKNQRGGSNNHNSTTTLLLLSIIESLCKAYAADDEKESDETANQHFLLICQTLKKLGVLNDGDTNNSHSPRSNSTTTTAFRQNSSGISNCLEGESFATFRSTSLEAFEQLFFNAKKRHNVSTMSTKQQQKQQQASSPFLSIRTGLNDRKLLTLTSTLTEEFSEEDGRKDKSCNEHKNMYSLFSLTFDGVRPARYHRDFHEIDILGHGGFASVWKAEHKLENMCYAIKKVPLKTYLKDDYEKIFREVKHLARLHHPNVVRYYTSWTEFVSNEYLRRGTNNLNGEENDDYEDYDDDGDDGDDEEVGDSLKEDGINSKKSKVGGTFVLFIQMELCNTTLHEFLRLRNQKPLEYFDEKQNVDIFRQILEGIEYIHQQGIIHRDLKPGNIFLTPPNTSTTTTASPSIRPTVIPKIGDFGLSVDMYCTTSPPKAAVIADDCDLTTDDGRASIKDVTDLFSSSAEKSYTSNVNQAMKRQAICSTSANLTRIKSGTRTEGVGTRTYASPEQLAVPCKVIYDEKVDIFSLGIILFELFQPFASAMERAQAIDQLKQKRVLPTVFQKKYPFIADIVLHMLHHDPTQRPSATELLQHPVFCPLNKQLFNSTNHNNHGRHNSPKSLTPPPHLFMSETESIPHILPTHSLHALPSPIQQLDDDGLNLNENEDSYFSILQTNNVKKMEKLEMKYKEAMMENEQLHTKLRLMEKQLLKMNMSSSIIPASTDLYAASPSPSLIDEVASTTTTTAADSGLTHEKRPVSKIFTNFILSSHH